MTNTDWDILLLLAIVAAVTVAWRQAERARRAERACRDSEDQGRPQTASPEPARALAAAAPHAELLDAVAHGAGDIAHDLNDLLAAIAGRAELAIAHLDPSHPAMEDAAEIRQAALTGARIARRLRTLGGARSATEVIEVNAVASRTVDALREMMDGGIEIVLALAPGVLHVRAGPGHVDEIILNLAINARAAMRDGGRLTVSTERHLRAGTDHHPGAQEQARLIVADTGALTDVDRAMRIDPMLESDGDDRAIGLAKVHSILQQAGGQIHVAAAAGRGTTFTIDLPLVVEPVARVAARELTAPVLVVEDEPHVRNLIKLVLSRAGQDVVAVAGPHEALALLSRRPAIDLLLLDVVMPDMSGYELAVQARALVADVRVVLMSGFACDAARQLPGDGFLPKPFKIESLHAAVQHALAS